MRRRGGLISLIIAMGAICFALNFIPILAATLGFLIPVAGIALVVFVIALIVSALKGNGSKTDNSQKAPLYRSVSIGGNSASSLEPEQAQLISNAENALFKAKYAANKLKDTDIRNALNQVIIKADLVIKTMKEQPEEIRKANQFFNYYLPTIEVVLQKYATLENSGEGEEYKAKVVDFLGDTGTAFDNLYNAMFKDEKLDLEVEVEAMQLSLKRDGLV